MRKFFEVLVAVIVAHDANHFNLIELMLTDHAASVTSIGTCFRTEARRVSGDLDGQIACLEHLARDAVGKRHLSRRNQVKGFTLAFLTALLGCKEVLLELRQLAGARSVSAVTI